MAFSSSNPPGYLIQTGVTPQAANQSTDYLTSGINQASKEYTKSTNEALNQLLSNYGNSFGLQAPAIQSGGYANAQLNYLLGLPSLSSPKAPTLQSGAGSDAINSLSQQQYDTLNPVAEYSQKLGQAKAGDISGIVSNLPGFQANLNQGIQAIQNAASAKGTLSSGNMLTELMNLGQGQEATYYNNYINNLAQQAGVGNTASQNQANQMNTLGQNTAQLQTNLGGNLANAALANGQARSTGLLSQLGSYQNQYTPTIDPQYTLAQNQSQYAKARGDLTAAQQQNQLGNSYYSWATPTATVNPAQYGLNSSGKGFLNS